MYAICAYTRIYSTVRYRFGRNSSRLDVTSDIAYDNGYNGHNNHPFQKDLKMPCKYLDIYKYHWNRSTTTNCGIPCAKLIIPLLLWSYDLVGFVEMWFSENGWSYFHRRNGVSDSGRLLFDHCSSFLTNCESTWLIYHHGYRTRHTLELMFDRINYNQKASNIIWFPAWTQKLTHCGALE